MIKKLIFNTHDLYYIELKERIKHHSKAIVICLLRDGVQFEYLVTNTESGLDSSYDQILSLLGGGVEFISISGEIQATTEWLKNSH